MAFPKKGFRKIHVDCNVFLWKVRKKISWNEIHDGLLGIPIQHTEGGQLLRVTIGYSRSYFTGNNEFQITPSMIEICIREAMKKGWNPRSTGPVFDFDAAGLIQNYVSGKNDLPTTPSSH